MSQPDYGESFTCRGCGRATNHVAEGHYLSPDGPWGEYDYCRSCNEADPNTKPEP